MRVLEVILEHVSFVNALLSVLYASMQPRRQHCHRPHRKMAQTPGTRHQTPGTRHEARSNNRQAPRSRCHHCRRSLDGDWAVMCGCMCSYNARRHLRGCMVGPHIIAVDCSLCSFCAVLSLFVHRRMILCDSVMRCKHYRSACELSRFQ